MRPINSVWVLMVAVSAFAGCADDGSDVSGASGLTTNGLTTSTTSTTAPPTTTTTIPTTTVVPVPTPTAAFSLIARTDAAETEHPPDESVLIPSPVLLNVGGGALEFIIRREDYSKPLTAEVSIVTGGQRRSLPLPEAAEFGWLGLQGFAEVTVRDEAGQPVDGYTIDFCPNSWSKVRTGPEGPDLDRYPTSCGGRTLSTGYVWGIAAGWAAPIDSEQWRDSALYPDGTYEVTVSIAEPYLDWLGSPAPATYELKVTTGTAEGEGFFDSDGDGIIDEEDPLYDTDGDGLDDFREDTLVDVDGDGLHDLFGTPNDVNPFLDSTGDKPVDGSSNETETETAAAAAAAKSAHRGRPSEPTAPPDATSLPDLRSLPAFDISVFNEEGLDLLIFGAVNWNAGPAPMVIDGFRSSTHPELLDGYQTFYTDGVSSGSAAIGSLEYHEGDGHDHWHFIDFARYELVDEESGDVWLSGKQAWCLVNNYPVDLTLPGVSHGAEEGDLQTSCGEPNALWIRETLAAGWGDEYHQSSSGQAFDISDVPNGVYLIRITANPEGSIFETSTTNNISERTVRLGGIPGARTVSVPSYQGLDTESYNDESGFYSK